MILHLDGKRVFQAGTMRMRGADRWGVQIDVAAFSDETGEQTLARLALSRDEMETLCAAAQLHFRRTPR
jgi:hypothetical protein